MEMCFGLTLNSGSEGPGQTVLMRRLIWTFADALCPKTCPSAVLLDIVSGLKFILCRILCLQCTLLYVVYLFATIMTGSVCANAQGPAHACRLVRVSAN